MIREWNSTNPSPVVSASLLPCLDDPIQATVISALFHSCLTSIYFLPLATVRSAYISRFVSLLINLPVAPWHVNPRLHCSLRGVPDCPPHPPTLSQAPLLALHTSHTDLLTLPCCSLFQEWLFPSLQGQLLRERPSRPLLIAAPSVTLWPTPRFYFSPSASHELRHLLCT